MKKIERNKKIVPKARKATFGKTTFQTLGSFAFFFALFSVNKAFKVMTMTAMKKIKKAKS